MFANEKLRRREEAQRQHRLRRSALPPDEHGEHGDAAEEGEQDQRVAPAAARLLDQREHRSGETDRAEQPSDHVDLGATRSGRFLAGDGVGDQRARDDRERHVDEEDPAPGRVLDEPAAAERPDHERDAGPGRPGADRGAAFLAAERRRDHGQAGRGEDRPRGALQAAREDQRGAVGRGGAEDRGEPERRDPDQEEPPGAEEVTERAADEQQRAEGEEVGIDDPLLQREPAAEVVLDGRQRHVHDRGVDEHDHRTEDAGHEDQAIASFGRQALDLRRPGPRGRAAPALG